MSDQTFQPGHQFFRPGDPADRAYLLSDGEVEILAGPAPGHRVATLTAGEVFGEMSLVEERPHRMTARAMTACRATTLSREEFEDGLLRDPARCRAYLVSLFERLRELSGADVTETPPAQAAARVALMPLTPTAAHGLPADGLTISRFPFRIGRASTHTVLGRNDLDLTDTLPFNVSRSHLQVERGPAGGLVVRDRGSHLGTWVNDRHIGGATADSVAPLHTGENSLILGSSGSPYRFRLTVDPTAP